MATSASRVLIYRLGSLGDMVVALPALHLIARAFPQSERHLLTNVPVNAKAPPASAILQNTGLIQSYIRYTVGTRSLRQLFLLWSELRRLRPTALVYLGAARGLPSARRDLWFFRLCGIKQVIGVPITDSMQQNLWDERTRSFEPEAARLVRNIAELGDAQLDSPAAWELLLTPEERARATSTIESLAGRPIIAVSVGTKVQSKDWGLDNWRELLGRVASIYPAHGLLLAGAPEEYAASESAAEAWRQTPNSGPIVNLCGQLTPRESAAAFEHARLFIGHDSGPMHLAAAVQTPCVAIFAARNLPRVWFPYGKGHRVLYHQVECAGCGLETCIIQRKKCLTSITVEEVLTQVRGGLDPSPK